MSTREKNISIVFAGDSKTGKSSLIKTSLTSDSSVYHFPPQVPSVLPPSVCSYRKEIMLIDTSSRDEERHKIWEAMRQADAVVLTYACHRPETLGRLSTYWLRELYNLKIKVPLVVVGCMSDLGDERNKLVMSQSMEQLKQFHEIETCIECSAANYSNMTDVIFYARRAAIRPLAPLVDKETKNLRRQYVGALKRIFQWYDRDKEDNLLSDAEIKEFQVDCSDRFEMNPFETNLYKKIVEDKLPGGMDEHGLTFEGFRCVYLRLIDIGFLDVAWTPLRKFGYNYEIRLDVVLPHAFKQAPSQSMELTAHAVEFLKGIFSTYDTDNDGAIQMRDVDDLFSTAPDRPWDEGPYKDAAPTTELGGLTMDGFLSEWALMTLLEPTKSLEYLNYIMYNEDVAHTLHLTRSRNRHELSDRNVYQCFVFGPRKAGKSALLDAFLGRPFTNNHVPNTEDRYAVNVVEGNFLTSGSKKFLVLREIPEEKVDSILSAQDSLASCDVAMFVYDSSDESSRKKTTDLLEKVAGFEVPCIIVAAKADLKPNPMSIQDTTLVREDFAQVPIAVKLGNYNNIFQTIVLSAESLQLPVKSLKRSTVSDKLKTKIH